MQDGDHIYTVMQAEYDPEHVQTGQVFPYIGILKADSDENKAYIQQQCSRLQKRVNGLRQSGKQEALANQNLQQAQETVENATKEAREKAQRILEAASKKEKEQLQASEEEAKRILISSRKQAEQERKKLLADTQDEMVTIAMLAARKAVGNNINEEKEKALFEDLLKKVGEV